MGKAKKGAVQGPRCTAKSKTTGEQCKQPAGAGTDHPGVGKCKFHGGKSPIKHGMDSLVVRPRIQALIEEYGSLTDEQKLRTYPELDKARALFHEWIERYEERTDALMLWKDAVEPPGEGDLLAMERLADEMEVFIGPALDEGRQDPDEPDLYRELRQDITLLRRRVKGWREAPAKKPRDMPDLADGHKILNTISQIADRITKQQAENYITREHHHRIMRQMGITVREVLEADELGLSQELVQKIGALVVGGWKKIALQ